MAEITIKDEIYQKLVERANQKAEFSSVQEYVDYILMEVVKKIEAEEMGLDNDNAVEDEAYSKEEEEKVKERLRGLGYID